MSTVPQPRGLRSMLEARSVAVVGASARKNSAGYQMIHQLVAGGFNGRVAPVNPKYQELEGHTCYPSLDEVPFDVDLAILGVPNASLVAEMEKVAAKRIPSAVIFASGYEGDPSDSTLIEKLKSIARDNDITVCGGNCMGFANFQHRLRALAFEEDETLEAGPIAWITHSGSAFTALLHNDRRLRFNLAVSAGQELTTTVADYIRYVIEQPGTGVVALFLETVRDPEGFRSALDAAAEADVPVVALKVGRAEEARRLVTAHSGALAGEDAVFDAVFEAHGVIRVSSLNEMADVLELFSSGRRPTGGGLGSVHDSGGERAHLIDAASEVGVSFGVISAKTQERLSTVLEPGLPPVNPVDAWGTGNDFEKIFLECFRALEEDDAIGAHSFTIDLAGEDTDWGYAEVAEQIYRETTKPFAILSNLSSAIDRRAADRLRGAGVPILEDTYSGLRAFKHLLDRRDHRALPQLDRSGAAKSEVAAKWASRLHEFPPLNEVETLSLLADYGIAVAPSRVVADVDEVVSAGAEVGYPVALKITGHDHKTEAGGVVLGIADQDGLTAAYERLSATFGRELVVQKMAEPGVEIALGVVKDEQFGPIVVVAAGGVLVEVLRDRKLAMPPLDQARARRLVDALEVKPVLDGYRGAPPKDVGSLADTIVSLSMLAHDLGEHFEALDVNPVVVTEHGTTAVDGLVVPAALNPASR